MSWVGLGGVAEAHRVSGKEEENKKPSEMVRRDLLRNEMAYLDRFRSLDENSLVRSIDLV
jgi:hypothetical protein